MVLTPLAPAEYPVHAHGVMDLFTGHVFGLFPHIFANVKAMLKKACNVILFSYRQTSGAFLGKV
jgi:hypothetical protein